MQTTVSVQVHPTDITEGPALREFGRSSSQIYINKFGGFKKEILIGALLLVSGGGLFAAYKLFSAPKAPDFNITKTAVIPELALSAVIAATPAVTTSVDNIPAIDTVAKYDSVEISILDVNQISVPASLEEAKAQIDLIKRKVAYLDSELVSSKLVVSAFENSLVITKKRENQPAKTKTIIKKAIEDEFINLSILDVDENHAVITESNRPNTTISVLAGSMLPGGATFLGFDPINRMMKTDQGEFYIR